MRMNKRQTGKQRIWQRSIVLLLLMSLLLSMVPEVMAKKKTSGTIDGTKWSYDTKTRTLTLSCKGKMDDEYSQMHGGDWPWEVWGDEMQNIVVEEGVTYLGSSIAGWCHNVKKVSLPKSLKKIGSSAFDSSKLIKVTLPPNLKTIAYGVFCNTKLKEVTIPQSVTTIGGYAFQSCKKLTKVKLPKKLEKISEGVFSYCPKLKTITLPKSINTIGKMAFYESGLTSITIPKKVTGIKAEAFSKCTSLKKVTFETQKLTAIDCSVFERCKKLKAITLPESITKLKDKAFKDSGLTTVTIPHKVTVVGEEAFSGCKSLKEIVFAGDQIASIGADAFRDIPTDCVIKVPAGQSQRMKTLLMASGMAETIVVVEE